MQGGNSGDLDSLRPRQSILLPLLLVVVSVVAIGSLIWNVAAFSLYSDDAGAKARLGILEHELDLARVEQDRLTKEIASLGQEKDKAIARASAAQATVASELAEVQFREGRLASERDTARAEVAELRRPPTELDIASESDVLKRSERFQIQAQLSDSAKKLGLTEGVLVEQIKSSGRELGFRFSDTAPTILVISVDALAAGARAPLCVRIAVIERWRIPDQRRSWFVSVCDRTAILDGTAREVQSAVAIAAKALLSDLDDARK